MEDLKAYWPKLRSGGIFAGHDYISADAQALKNTNQDWSGASVGWGCYEHLVACDRV